MPKRIRKQSDRLGHSTAGTYLGNPIKTASLLSERKEEEMVEEEKVAPEAEEEAPARKTGPKKADSDKDGSSKKVEIQKMPPKKRVHEIEVESKNKETVEDADLPKAGTESEPKDDDVPPPPAAVAAQEPESPAKGQASDESKKPKADSKGDKAVKGDKTPKKRKKLNPNHHRLHRKTQRKFFSQEEINAIFAGVQQFGEGRWAKIKNSRPQLFADRTTLDLKDKWRNIKRRPSTNKKAAGKKRKAKGKKGEKDKSKKGKTDEDDTEEKKDEEGDKEEEKADNEGADVSKDKAENEEEKKEEESKEGETKEPAPEDGEKNDETAEEKKDEETEATKAAA